MVIPITLGITSIVTPVAEDIAGKPIYIKVQCYLYHYLAVQNT